MAVLRNRVNRAMSDAAAAIDGASTGSDGESAALDDGEAGIDVTNPTFDVTPADCVAGIVTERGVLGPDEIGPIADEFRDVEAWR